MLWSAATAQPPASGNESWSLNNQKHDDPLPSLRELLRHAPTTNEKTQLGGRLFGD